MSMDDTSDSNSDYEYSNNKMKKIQVHNPKGFGNVLQKILSQKSNSILSKRTKNKVINKFNKDDDDNDSADENGLILSDTQHTKSQKKSDWEEMCHTKDSIFDKDKEKRLQKIATRGVVTLFNSVRRQQSIIENKLKDTKSIRAKEKFLSSDLSKSKFIDMLKSEDELISSDDGKSETKNWKVLRDDFMMDADLKDWDKMSDNEENDEHKTM